MKKITVNESGRERKNMDEAIKAHILDHFDSTDDFISSIEHYMKHVQNRPISAREALKTMVEYGSFLVYYSQILDFFISLGFKETYPNIEEWDGKKMWNWYTALVARNGEELYRKAKEMRDEPIGEAVKTKKPNKVVKCDIKESHDGMNCRWYLGTCGGARFSAKVNVNESKNTLNGTVESLWVENIGNFDSKWTNYPRKGGKMLISSILSKVSEEHKLNEAKISRQVRWGTEEELSEDDYLDSFEYIYSQLVNGNISHYREYLKKLADSKEIKDYELWGKEVGVDPQIIEYLYESKRSKTKIVYEAQEISKSVLMSYAEQIERSLKEEGFDVELKPYFAYGAYGYYFDFPNNEYPQIRQEYTGLGTKKECLNNLKKTYYMILAYADKYKVGNTENKDETEN